MSYRTLLLAASISLLLLGLLEFSAAGARADAWVSLRVAAAGAWFVRALGTDCIAEGVLLRTADQDVEASVGQVLAVLRERKVIPG